MTDQENAFGREVEALEKYDGRHMDPAEFLLLQIRAAGLPEPDREVEFAKRLRRKWRFDFSWGEWLALEFEGGSFTSGRHQRGKGFEADLVKYAVAEMLGWIVIRVNNHMVEDGRALLILQWLFGHTLTAPNELAKHHCEKCMTKAEKLKRLAKETK